MLHRLDEPDQLALVRRQLRVPRRNPPAEEHDSAFTLVKNSTEPGVERITFDDEFLIERRQL
jgi:hypothetical protein